jgi:hypothetical protein
MRTLCGTWPLYPYPGIGTTFWFKTLLTMGGGGPRKADDDDYESLSRWDDFSCTILSTIHPYSAQSHVIGAKLLDHCSQALNWRPKRGAAQTTGYLPVNDAVALVVEPICRMAMLHYHMRLSC